MFRYARYTCTKPQISNKCWNQRGMCKKKPAFALIFGRSEISQHRNLRNSGNRMKYRWKRCIPRTEILISLPRSYRNSLYNDITLYRPALPNRKKYMFFFLFLFFCHLAQIIYITFHCIIHRSLKTIYY